MRSDLNIPHKASRVLNLVLLAFLLILLRTWYLGFAQGDYHRQEARKPQRKTTLEKVERATIRDRFNTPLSQNKINYAVAVRYADIREIPSHKWIVNQEGKKTKELIRGPYISSLALLLAELLQMEPQEIEDTIYAKATLFPHTPFIIKESIQENLYYRIRALQKDWPGIEAMKNAERIYPQGKTACDIVGYMGAISSSEYLQIAQEIAELEEYIQKRENGELSFLPKGHESPLTVRKRLLLLKEKAYTINDSVGKTGIEASYDELLRGIHGKKIAEVDPKGNVLRILPGAKKGVSGQRIFLSISCELQEFAESLLAENEKIRDLKDRNGKRIPGVPWIKGGAIVALNPKTGEVLTLASYPRLDPNDFIPSQDPLLKTKKQQSVRRWVENEAHIGELFEGKAKLTKEIYSFKTGWEEESIPLTWDYFLTTILPPSSALWQSLEMINNIKNAHSLQSHFLHIMQQVDFKDPNAIIEVLFPEPSHIAGRKKISIETTQFLQTKLTSQKEELKESIDTINSFLSPIPYNDDKILLLDILRLLILEDAWTPSLLQKIAHISLADFFALSQSLNIIQGALKEKTEKLHHQLGFQEWREKYLKKFLAQKRKEEKKQKKYAKPYTEYLEKVEKTLFKSFWNACKYLFLDAMVHGKQRISLEEYPELRPYLASIEKTENLDLIPHIKKLQKELSELTTLESVAFLKTIRSFEELDRPLYGKYRLLRNTKGVQLEKHLAAAFYPLVGFGYGRSQAFRQSTPQGSVFKLVIAYEALKEKYEFLKENLLSLKDLNPLTLIDDLRAGGKAGSTKQILGYTIDGQPIHRLYKGAILPRSSHGGIGKVDLLQAIEQSSNLYFSILAAEHVASPLLLEKASKDFGFGAKTGIDLQGEISGAIPNDLSDNKTGLYSFAIGQHSLIGTPLQAAQMLSALGNNGHIVRPKVVKLTAGKNRVEDPFAFSLENTFSFQESLSLIGIHFPLFTEALATSYNPFIQKNESEISRSIFYPPEIRHMLLSGMDKVITGPRGTARPSIIRYLKTNPQAMRDYLSLQGEMIGKTGTAEILYKQWLDAESEAKIHNHIWFGGLVFPEGSNWQQEDAELAIIVYLRFSEAGGKEAAPLAASIAKKWKEIQKKHQ